MKILLSGGSGFIGRKLLNFFEQNHKKFEILNISRSSKFKKNNNISHIELDLNNIDNGADEIKNFRPDIFLHLAWQGIPDYSEEISKINYLNSLKIINFVINETCCSKIISTGSCWEYNDGNLIGKCDEGIITKPQKSFSIYKTKIFNDIIKIADEKGILLNWLRLFYVYGPEQKNGSIIPSLINDIKNNNKININYPSNKNDFIYIDDVVKIIVKFTLNDNPSGIYNVGTGIATPIYDLLKIIDFEINNNYQLSNKYLKSIDIDMCNQNFFACTNKLKKYFNNLNFIDLRTGIQKVLEK